MPAFPTAFSSWTHRQKITAPVVSEVIPYAMIPLSQLGTDFWLYGDRDSVRVTLDDEETETPFFITLFDTGTDVGGIIAKVDTILSMSVTADFWVYWGNVAASEYVATDTYGRNAVFPSSIKAFYTLTDTATPALVECTGSGNDLTVIGSPTGQQSGPFEGAQSYSFPNSTASYLRASTAITTLPISIECFFKVNSLTAYNGLFGAYNSANNNNLAATYLAGTLTNDPVAFGVRGNSGTTSSAATSPPASSTGTWYYASGSRDAHVGTTKAYKNGGSAGSQTTTITATATYNRMAVGVSAGSTLQNPLDGYASMCVASNVVRSANYFSTMYSMFTTTTWWTFGTTETNSAATLTLAVDCSPANPLDADASVVFFPVMYLSGTVTISEAPVASGVGRFVFSTGEIPLRAASQAGSGTSWTSVASATIDDNAYAEVVLPADSTPPYSTLSKELFLLNPDLSVIPAGSYIHSVQFKINALSDAGLFNFWPECMSIHVVNNGVAVGDNLISESSFGFLETSIFSTLQPNIDLQTLVFDPDFGLVTVFGNNEADGDGTVWVDAGWVQIVYSPPEVVPTPFNKFRPMYN